MTAPRISHYEWSGGREAMLRFGPDHGPTVIAALPLFEEANRTRAAMVDVLRRLAARGIAGALPDLPGTGESLVETADATLADWRGAFAAAAATLPGPVHVVAWRGGAVVDAEAVLTSRWWLAPLDGAGVMRDLRRAQAVSDNRHLFAGNALSAELIADLEAARISDPARPELARTGEAVRVPLRTLRLDTDPRPADAHIAGRPLWRAAEPGTDAALQAALADDIAAWIVTCAS